MEFPQLFEIVAFLSVNAANGKGGGSLWNLIPEPLRLLFLLALFFVELLVLAVLLHFAGLIIVGGRKARFSDAFIIALIGNVLSTLFFAFIPYYWVASFLSIITWLLLIKNLYETGWLGAIAVGILVILIYLAIVIILLFVFGIIKEIGEFLPFFNLSLLFGCV
ncbi:hypothetical protein DRO44_05025 [Candidatus Bathyarchaeota archaeon]|nr:MAG: hypothetical protein DRO44_05025 [Candidatus Bathyarchaeota archaeon]